jgi:hypothetical protein
VTLGGVAPPGWGAGFRCVTGLPGMRWSALAARVDDPLAVVGADGDRGWCGVRGWRVPVVSRAAPGSSQGGGYGSYGGCRAAEGCRRAVVPEAYAGNVVVCVGGRGASRKRTRTKCGRLADSSPFSRELCAVMCSMRAAGVRKRVGSHLIRGGWSRCVKIWRGAGGRGPVPCGCGGRARGGWMGGGLPVTPARLGLRARWEAWRRGLDLRVVSCCFEHDGQYSGTIAAS